MSYGLVPAELALGNTGSNRTKPAGSEPRIRQALPQEGTSGPGFFRYWFMIASTAQ